MGRKSGEGPGERARSEIGECGGPGREGEPEADAEKHGEGRWQARDGKARDRDTHRVREIKIEIGTERDPK